MCFEISPMPGPAEAKLYWSGNQRKSLQGSDKQLLAAAGGGWVQDGGSSGI